MMKIKIDKDGSLWVWRRFQFKKQFCPFSDVDKIISCSDSCPHFGEPEKDVSYILTLQGVLESYKENEVVWLKLSCGNLESIKVTPEDFTDERNLNEEIQTEARHA